MKTSSDHADMKKDAQTSSEQPDMQIIRPVRHEELQMFESVRLSDQLIVVIASDAMVTSEHSLCLNDSGPT